MGDDVRKEVKEISFLLYDQTFKLRCELTCNRYSKQCLWEVYNKKGEKLKSIELFKDEIKTMAEMFKNFPSTYDW